MIRCGKTRAGIRSVAMLAAALTSLPAFAAGGAGIVGAGTCAIRTQGGPIASQETLKRIAVQTVILDERVAAMLSRLGHHHSAARLLSEVDGRGVAPAAAGVVSTRIGTCAAHLVHGLIASESSAQRIARRITATNTVLRGVLSRLPSREK